MSRGGKREGAGRKRGAPNKATQERQAKVAATGATRLEVMIRKMRFHLAIADREMAKGEAADTEKVIAALDKAEAYVGKRKRANTGY